MLRFVVVFRNCLVAFGSNAIYWSGKKKTKIICKQYLMPRGKKNKNASEEAYGYFCCILICFILTCQNKKSLENACKERESESIKANDDRWSHQRIITSLDYALW